MEEKLDKILTYLKSIDASLKIMVTPQKSVPFPELKPYVDLSQQYVDTGIHPTYNNFDGNASFYYQQTLHRKED